MTRVRIAIALWFALVALAVIARADDRWPEWDAAERLTLAQAIAAENSGNEADSAAMGWLFVRTWRRFEVTRIDGVIQNYCALWDRYSRYYARPSSVAIRAATLDTAPQGPDAAGWAKKWPRIVAFVDRFAARQITDTCPGSRTFGGAMDVPRMKGKAPRCRLVNLFW